MNLKILSSLVVFMALGTSLVYAHGGASEKPIERRTAKPNQPPLIENETRQEMHGKLIQQKKVGEFELKFKIVDVKESVPDGGSHNLLVNIKRNGRNQKRLSVTSTVDDMQGEIKSKSMMELGDWHLAGYDFFQDSDYVITVSFKSADGATHTSSIKYP